MVFPAIRGGLMNDISKCKEWPTNCLTVNQWLMTLAGGRGKLRWLEMFNNPARFFFGFGNWPTFEFCGPLTVFKIQFTTKQFGTLMLCYMNLYTIGCRFVAVPPEGHSSRFTTKDPSRGCSLWNNECKCYQKILQTLISIFHSRFFNVENFVRNITWCWKLPVLRDSIGQLVNVPIWVRLISIPPGNENF